MAQDQEARTSELISGNSLVRHSALSIVQEARIILVTAYNRSQTIVAPLLQRSAQPYSLGFSMLKLLGRGYFAVPIRAYSALHLTDTN